MHGPLFLRPCTDFVGHAISGSGPPHTHPYTPRSGSCTQQIVWDALASQPGPQVAIDTLALLQPVLV